MGQASEGSLRFVMALKDGVLRCDKCNRMMAEQAPADVKRVLANGPPICRRCVKAEREAKKAEVAARRTARAQAALEREDVDFQCNKCGKDMYQSRFSAKEEDAKCLECRRADMLRCAVCGGVMPRSRFSLPQGEAMHRACRMARSDR